MTEGLKVKEALMEPEMGPYTCAVEGPSYDRTIRAHCTSMEVSHSHLFDVGGIKVVGCIGLVDEREGD